MRTRALTLVGLCTFSLAACQPADRGTRTLSAEDDVAAVRNMEHDFFAAQMAGDQDAWAALVDIDPVWMPPGAPTVAGSEAVREFARPMFEEWVVGDVSADADYGTFGDWGYSAWREGTWTITPKAGGEPISETATALLIAHRGEDGQWRFARSMWNQVTPGEPPTPVAGQELVALVASGPEEDIAAIKRYFERYEEVVAAKDMSGIAGLWTEDALWMPPGSPSLEGTPAFMRLAGDFLETHDVVGLEMDLEEVQAADGMAFVRVAASGTYVSLAGGEEPWAFTEREWFIMQRQNDGSWLATHCIWHPDVAAG